MNQSLMPPSDPEFVVIEVDSFPDSAPSDSTCSVAWHTDGHGAVITMLRDLELRRKLKALRWCTDYLEKHLTPDGTGYWEGELKLVAWNASPIPTQRRASKPALAVAR